MVGIKLLEIMDSEHRQKCTIADQLSWFEQAEQKSCFKTLKLRSWNSPIFESVQSWNSVSDLKLKFYWVQVSPGALSKNLDLSTARITNPIITSKFTVWILKYEVHIMNSPPRSVPWMITEKHSASDLAGTQKHERVQHNILSIAKRDYSPW